METVHLAKNTVKLTKTFYVHPFYTNYAASKDGETINVKERKVLKLCKNKNGYSLDKG